MYKKRTERCKKNKSRPKKKTQETKKKNKNFKKKKETRVKNLPTKKLRFFSTLNPPHGQEAKRNEQRMVKIKTKEQRKRKK